MSNLPLYLVTFVAYGALAVYFWREQAAGREDTLCRGMVCHAVLLPLTLHGYLLYENLFIDGEMNFGLVYSVSLILWVTMLVYWVGRFFYPIASLQTLVLPLAVAVVTAHSRAEADPVYPAGGRGARERDRGGSAGRDHGREGKYDAFAPVHQA